MSGRLEGKVAVVTGAANGIGRASAVRFAEEGAAVVIADVLDDAGRGWPRELTAKGAQARFVHADAASEADNESVAETATSSFGGLDVLVTAAGISHAGYRSGDLAADMARAVQHVTEYAHRPGWELVEADLDEVRTVIDVNLFGTLMAIQACSRRMLTAGTKGSIITIASVAAKHPDAGPFGYVLSKAAVWMLTKKAARMLAPTGIRVNAIGPGYIDTNMTASSIRSPRISGRSSGARSRWRAREHRPRSPTPRCSSPPRSRATSRARSSIPTAATTRSDPSRARVAVIHEHLTGEGTRSYRSGATAEEESTVSADDNIKTIQSVYEAFGRGDAAAILDAVTDDVDWGTETTSSVAPWFGIRHGKDQVGAFFHDFGSTMEVEEFTPTSFGSNDTDVFTIVRLRSRSRATGRVAAMNLHHYFRFRDGKIYYYRGSEDTAQTEASVRA